MFLLLRARVNRVALDPGEVQAAVHFVYSRSEKWLVARSRVEQLDVANSKSLTHADDLAWPGLAPPMMGN
jgi:hypothetical protein